MAFIFQKRMIRLFTWRTPSHTLSFLAIYTFVCLDPSLLAVLPVVFCLLFIMVPAFVARHPPPPSNTPVDLYNYQLNGPPLAPAASIKPTPEFSRDFFHNMRDLQNCMDDFSRLHDTIINNLAPTTNFSNEALSSTIFLFLSLLACMLFIVANLLPWRALALIAGWVATFAGLPSFREKLIATRYDQFVRSRETVAKSSLEKFIAHDVLLSSASETREVEVFELQYRNMHASSNAEFEPFIFSPSPYTPLSPSRIAGERPFGTRFFEDLRPPPGWRWSDKKWTLDLLSREWVEDRCITGVEVEVEGEKWVTDILFEEDEQDDESAPESSQRKVEDRAMQTARRFNPERRIQGEWRRRRWIRLVERKMATGSDQKG